MPREYLQIRATFSKQEFCRLLQGAYSVSSLEGQRAAEARLHRNKGSDSKGVQSTYFDGLASITCMLGIYKCGRQRSCDGLPTGSSPRRTQCARYRTQSACSDGDGDGGEVLVVIATSTRFEGVCCCQPESAMSTSTWLAWSLPADVCDAFATPPDWATKLIATTTQ
jgi:hypothetical protein